MLIAVLADIHANLEAFLAVIDDLERARPDTVICLGDLIGYGPNPEEVVRLVQQKGYLTILGNHEAALKDVKMRNWLNFQAKENSIQTEQLLSKESLSFCYDLPEFLYYEDALFVHGFPPKSVLGYLTMKSKKQIQTYFQNSTEELCFVGHSHELHTACWDGTHLKIHPLVGSKYSLKIGNKYIINTGSVGQPRDGNNKAKYILWHTQSREIEVIQIGYDFKTTSRKIEERGFPEAYGYRLW